jgi:hypothetical protein
MKENERVSFSLREAEKVFLERYEPASNWARPSVGRNIARSEVESGLNLSL